MYAPYTTITRRGGGKPYENAAGWPDVHKEHKRETVGDRTGGAQQQERDTRHKKLGGRSRVLLQLKSAL